MRANSNRQKDLLGHLSTCVWQSLQQQLPQNGRFVTQHRSPRRAEGDCQASSLSHFYLKALKCTDPSVHSFKLFPASSLIQHWHTGNYRRSASVHELSPFTSGVQSRAWPPKALETVISQTGIQKILTRFSMKLWKWQGSVSHHYQSAEAIASFPSTSGFQPFGHLPQNNCSVPLSSQRTLMSIFRHYWNRIRSSTISALSHIPSL